MAARLALTWKSKVPSPRKRDASLLTRPVPVQVRSRGRVRERELRHHGDGFGALLRSVDTIMPTTARMIPASPFLRHYPQKCHTVPLGIDLTAFEPGEASARAGAEIRARLGGPLVLFVGRMMAYKGVDHLLRAMRDVRARLVVVGDGPDLPRVRALAGELGLGERVTFTGRVEPTEVVHWIAAADVGVLPSVQEAYGLSMVEMMAHGRPVVCTELGTGTTEINRDGETGLVVPPADPPALAAALNRLLGDEALRRRLGVRAREWANERFSLPAMLRAIHEVYTRAVAAHARD